MSSTMRLLVGVTRHVRSIDESSWGGVPRWKHIAHCVRFRSAAGVRPIDGASSVASQARPAGLGARLVEVQAPE